MTGASRKKAKKPSDGFPLCLNHPSRKVLGFCHVCGDRLWWECLEEGRQYYYCRKPKCQRAWRESLLSECPSCGKPVRGKPIFCRACGYRLEPISAEETDDLVTVARFGTSLEAQLAQTKLTAERIASYVGDEHVVSLMPLYDLPWGGVKLRVRHKDLARALQALGEGKAGSFWTPRLLYAGTYVTGHVVVGFLMMVVGVLLFFICRYFGWWCFGEWR
ncbi:MAG TPA: hypothetical protein VFR02_08925 [bacterium]|nr:hypothetical protein [bacterium]